MIIRLRSLSMAIAMLLFLTQCATLESLISSPGNDSHTTTTRSSTSNDSRLRQNIVDFALDLQGTPYKYAGRSPRAGFDCSGFTHYVMDNFDISLTPVSRIQEEEGQRIRLEDAQAGDLVFFRRSAAGSVFHVALVVSNGREGLRVIHSTSSRGVIIDNIQQSSYWRGKLSSARRVVR